MIKSLEDIKKSPWDIQYPAVKFQTEAERRERNLQAAYQSFDRALQQASYEMEKGDHYDLVHLYEVFEKRWKGFKAFVADNNKLRVEARREGFPKFPVED